MAWLETPSSRDNSEAERRLAEQKKQREQREQRERERPPETTQDVRTKEVFRIALPVIKEALSKQKQIMEQMITELKAKELTFGNFANPENLMGFSTLVRWDGKTNTGERLETIENFQARSNIVFSSLLRLEYALSSWQRIEDIQKDPSMVAFFMSPEAKYMSSLSGGTPVDTAMQEYNLRKARNLKDFIINGDILAESYYDKLKWTPYEKEADKERMGKLEYARKKWLTDFGNTFLSLDQLGLLVAWWAIWKSVWAAVAMSPKLAQVSIQATEKLSNGVPWVVTKIIPWVNAIKTQTGEWIATSLWKFGVNFSLEVWKFAWYEALAKQYGWDDTAKIVAMLMIAIPWAKEGFASSLRGKIAKEWKQIQAWEVKWEFVKWIQTNYGEDKAKQMLYAGLVEAKMQSGKMTKTGYDAEVGKTVDVMMASILSKTEPIKQAVGQVTQTLSHTPSPPIKRTDTPKTTPSEVPKEQIPEKQTVSSQEKTHTTPETTKYKILYEDPEYSFLAWEKYKKLREVFPNLSHKDIIGEWNNWIILRHPDTTKVIKIEKPNGDKLDVEFKNQKAFLEALIILKAKLKDKPEYAYLQKFKIPNIRELEWMRWVYEMEKVNGHALKTLVTIKVHSASLKDLPDGWYKNLTDNEVDIFLRGRWLQTYPKSSTEMDTRWMNDTDRHFIVDLESEWTKMMRSEDVEKLITLLNSNGYKHGDGHWWNAMKTPDGNIYLIDFWRSKLPVENK